MEFSHDDLTKIAEKWLLSRCGFAFRELNTMSRETPDAIGFRMDGSILVECKTSRSDFHADRKKSFRRCPWQGVGLFRFFLCPRGIIKSDDLPEKWGLLYVNEKGKVRKQVGPKGNIWSKNTEWMFTERNIQNETNLMYSALRRLQIQGVMPLIYEKYRKKTESKTT